MAGSDRSCRRRGRDSGGAGLEMGPFTQSRNRAEGEAILDASAQVIAEWLMN